MELWVAGLLLLSVGAAAGFFAGLFGIGGGGLLVPAIYFILEAMGYGEHAMHIAVGTSLATIIFTGASSGWAHYKKGAVEVSLFRTLLPGVFMGVILGSVLADFANMQVLKIIFVTTQVGFGLYMLIVGNKTSLFQSMPSRPVALFVETLIGCLATLKGVGGGVQNVVFMTLCNVPLHRAIATAACFGPFIAIAGTLGFIVIGFNEGGLPPLSLGYVNGAAFGAIVLSSVFTAPLGVHVAHSLNVAPLKRAFSIFLLLLAAKMMI